jgi:hypothetical protein
MRGGSHCSKQNDLARQKTGRNTPTVWVGTIIADRPPHRTVRAALPHTAPTLEGWREVLLLAHCFVLGTLVPRTVWGEWWTDDYKKPEDTIGENGLFWNGP